MLSGAIMSGFFWQIITFVAAGIFLAITLYRILTIKHQPVHLRWELAPLPCNTDRIKHHTSHLEEFEWWRKPRKKARIPQLIYMAHEIFLFKGVWKNNRPLWPFSFSLHIGIFLFILALALYLINAVLIITTAPRTLQQVFQDITAIVTAIGFIAGSLGAIGLTVKRFFEAGLRNFSSFSTFFRLIFLAAVFVSGGIAMLVVTGYTAEMTVFVKGLITLDTGFTVSIASSIHIILSLLFIIYLPFTDMIHFIIKHFTYYAVRWNDAPQDSRMTEELQLMMAQAVDWSAAHAGDRGGNTWTQLTGEKGEKEKS